MTEADPPLNVWGIIPVAASGTKSATDSPAGKYKSNTESFVWTTAPLDLTGERGCRVHFKWMYEIEASFDALFAGALTPGESFDGTFFDGVTPNFPNQFHLEEVSISDLDDRSDVYPAFGLLSDKSVELDGAYVDDVRVICRDETYVNEIASLAEYDQPNAGSYVGFQGTSGSRRRMSPAWPRLLVQLNRQRAPSRSSKRSSTEPLPSRRSTPNDPPRPLASSMHVRRLRWRPEADVAVSCPGKQPKRGSDLSHHFAVPRHLSPGAGRGSYCPSCFGSRSISSEHLLPPAPFESDAFAPEDGGRGWFSGLAPMRPASPSFVVWTGLRSGSARLGWRGASCSASTSSG